MLAQVNARLGFQGSNQLSILTVLTIWEICRFEKNNDLSAPSPFCAAFSVANNQVLEYHSDLTYFYTNGYGNSDRGLIQNLPCGLIQDLLSHLQSNDDEPVARVFGTHSSNFQVLLAALGVFEDEDFITRHNLAQQNSRQWKTSWISPKGANLAVVRYE